MRLIGLLLLVCLAFGCAKTPGAQSISGVAMATVDKVETDSAGHTIEQRNLIERIKRDNETGALKHLYVISAYSGQTILYSPVRGKVTSGGKRLNPKAVDGTSAANNRTAEKPSIKVGGVWYTVSELTNEDGTYGSGAEGYIFWFTPDGRYHQHYMGGGQIVHIADQPLNVKGVIITVESK